jgi:SAM-dependent methyltransferase
MQRRSADRFFQILVDPISLRREVRRSLMGFFRKHLTGEMSVFDVGCGDKTFAAFMAGRVKEYIGVDIEDGFYDSGHIDLIGDAHSVPIGPDLADAVISSQVLQHLERPLDELAEAHPEAGRPAVVERSVHVPDPRSATRFPAFHNVLLAAPSTALRLPD